MKSKAKLLVLLLLVFLIAGSLMAAPRLTIPHETFDFGFVPQNSKISHDFWLESTGDDTLKILKVVPG